MAIRPGEGRRRYHRRQRLHLIDLLLYLAGGEARGLRARVLDGEKEGMPHSFACIFDTTTGVTVSACGSYMSPANSVQEEVSVWGTEGALFARRFCKEWNTDPPLIFYKSADGSVCEDIDPTHLPIGKTLPLETLLAVLSGPASRDRLLTEGKDTLETHRVIGQIRQEFNLSSSG